MTHAIIDGDVILYSVGFASEERYYICTDGTTFNDAKAANSYCKQFNFEKFLVRVPAEEHVWKGNANAMIKNIVAAAGCDSYTLYLTGGDNFRNEIYPDYKANRKDVPKPHCYKDLKAYLLETHPATLAEGIEADDMLGWKQTKDTVLCTIDKDLDMIAGAHYNWNKKERGVYSLGAAECEYNFWVQTLTGDGVDNIQGIKGVGPAKAAKLLLDKPDDVDYYDYCKKQYEGNEHEEIFDIICSLLWIMRSEGSTFKELMETEDE